MVYDPVETAFLSVGRARTIDGLTMLLGQAARGFELFFGVRAPAPDERLRGLLLRD
jgi:shikimate dehydrogenase